MKRNGTKSNTIQFKFTQYIPSDGNLKCRDFHRYRVTPYYISPYLNLVGNKIVPLTPLRINNSRGLLLVHQSACQIKHISAYRKVPLLKGITFLFSIFLLLFRA